MKRCLTLLLFAWLTSGVLADEFGEPPNPLFTKVDPANVDQLLLALRDPLERNKAAKMLVKLGPPAVPGLIEMLKDKDPDLVMSVVDVLGRMGPAASPAIGPLMKHFTSKDLETVGTVSRTLASIGEPAIAPMVAALQHRDARVQTAAARTLATLGPAAESARPAIVGALRAKPDDKLLRFWLIAALGTMPGDSREDLPLLTRALKEMDLQDVPVAAKAIAQLGPAASSAVPALMHEFRSKRSVFTMEAAIDALVAIGPAAVPPLLESLRDKDRDAKIRDFAAFGLYRIGQPAVPALIQGLSDADQAYREQVSTVLSSIGEPVVGPLLEAFPNQKPLTQFAMARVLGRIPVAAEMAVPGLIAGLQYGDRETRMIAIAALGQMGPTAKQAAPALMMAVRVDDAMRGAKDEEARTWLKSYVRAIQEALIAIGEPAVPYLNAAFQDESEILREVCAKALEEIGNSNKEAVVPALVSSLMNKDPAIRRQALDALAKVYPRPMLLARLGPKAFPALVVAMRHNDERLRAAAALAIAMHREKGLPALVYCLRDRNRDVRLAAAVAIGALHEWSEKAVPYMITALRIRAEITQSPLTADETWDHYYRTFASAIANVRTPAIPVLIETLKDEDPKIRWVATLALSEIGWDAFAAVPALIASLDDDDLDVRRTSIVALGKIGPRAKEAAPALLDALTKRDERHFPGQGTSQAWNDYREACTKTLSKIGEAAVPTLLEGLLGDEPETQRYCAVALLTIAPKSPLDEMVGEDPLERLMALVEDRQVEVRVAAIDAIGLFGTTAGRAIPTLIKAARANLTPDEREALQKIEGIYLGHITTALERIGEPAVPELLEAAREKDPNVRSVAIWSLKKIAPDASSLIQVGPELIPVLIDALRYYNTRFGAQAADAIVSIGDPAVRPLLEAHKHEDRLTRFAAEVTLARLHESSAISLAEALTDKDAAIRAAAARALGGDGPAAVNAIPVTGVIDALREALKDPDDLVRMYAARSLKWLDPATATEIGIE